MVVELSVRGRVFTDVKWQPAKNVPILAMGLSNDKILELLEMEMLALRGEGVCDISFSTDCLKFLKEKLPQKFNSPKLDQGVAVGLDHPEEIGATAELRNRQKKIILPEGSKLEKYEWLKNKVLQCEECKKHVRHGKKIVFGVGNVDADILFCGEAPGADEETIGEPFVGCAGRLLTKVIIAMGLSRSDVYIANIMNWRPEMPTEIGNRPPTQEEMEICLPYLLAQIEIVQPKVIVALGATATSGLLGHDPSRRMRDIRGKWMAFADTPLMITFHPSYLLYSKTNSAKRLLWEDMLAVMEKLNLPISEKQRNYFL
ncbi:MAG: uracil-DNA glycosylase [Puniceicoccales bacterium]|nr:uracil-DNA glycosylase [Puniceicoccales bacterium]